MIHGVKCLGEVDENPNSQITLITQSFGHSRSSFHFN